MAFIVWLVVKIKQQKFHQNSKIKNFPRLPNLFQLRNAIKFLTISYLVTRTLKLKYLLFKKKKIIKTSDKFPQNQA